MHVTSGRRLFLLSALLLSVPLARAQWTAPTSEELSMISQPQVPGAPAVYLFREETTDDKLHMFSIYTRLKVLTERGKEYANVELQFAKGREGWGFTVENIEGRTIHPDGTVIPFTGKPYEKLIEKTQGAKIMAKVFTMPDVEIGSIIEYRYKLRYDDNLFRAPDWYVQSNLWTRKGHYVWKPLDLANSNIILTGERGQTKSIIAWTPVLPSGTQVEQSRVPGLDTPLIELHTHDIPPIPDEDYMAPIGSYSYRVLFYYSAYRTAEEYWKGEGKYWSKAEDKFIGPGSAVTAAVKDLVAPGDTQDQKLRKIYAAVMKLENTSFTRQHSSEEEKAQGFKEVRTTDDIWTRKRGSDDQIAGLFIAMARAAGLKAYAARVTNRSRALFLKEYLSTYQLDDLIAIVNIDGKEQFFDPGSRYCPYQHLAWQHTLADGIRQTDGGTDFVSTMSDPYTYSRTQRIADLAIDQQGALTGNITMTYSGTPALRWRQRALQGDSESLQREIRTSVERLLPSGVEVKVSSIDKLEDYEQPLVAKLEVKGTLGSSTGKRLLLPGDIFEATSKPAFTHEKRETAVYFEYPRLIQDAVRIKFPPTFTVESIPAADKSVYKGAIGYTLDATSTPNSFTVHRNFTLGGLIFQPSDYAEMRTFYTKMQSKDQESVVLNGTSATAKSTPPGN